MSVTDTLTGAGTYTVPAGVYLITVRRWAAGGSGGGTGAVIGWNGAGGGSGEFIQDTVAVTPGQQFAYSVGTGGPRKINALGVKGGDTTFGGLSAAHGGLGGTCQQSSNATGALGGTGGSGDIQRDGAQGGSGQVNNHGGGGAAPGDAANPAEAGSGKTGATGPVSTGGTGGDATTPNGTDATAPGAGGGGAYSNTAANRQSGAGGDGRIEVEYTSTLPGQPALDSGSVATGTGSVQSLTCQVPIPSGAATVPGASPRQWLADAGNIHSMYGADPATTATFFDNANGFLMGHNPSADPVQDGLAANPVLNYKSYADFQADITAAAIDKSIYTWVLYDPEYSSDPDNPWPTPIKEAEDPWTYMKSFTTLAHKNGFSVILTPARDLGNCPTTKKAKNPGESINDWYIRTGIATAAAESGAEVYEIQDQANTLVDGAPPYTTFVNWFNSAKAQARAVSATQKIWCGISTNYGTAAQMYAAASAVDADGYWMNMIGDIAKSNSFFDLAEGMPARPANVVRAGVLVCIWCTAGTSLAAPWSAPGFTAVTAVTGTNGASQLLYRIADGTEGWVPGVSTVTVTAASSRTFNCHAVSCSDTHLTTPLDPVPSVSGQVNAASQTISVAGITTAQAPDLGIWFGATAGTASGGDTPPAITVPAGWSAVGSQVNTSATGGITNVGSRIATKGLPSAGATGAANGSIAGGVNKATNGMLLAFRPAATPPAPPPSALCGAFISPDLYGGDQGAGIAAFETLTGRTLGVRATSYAQGIIPLDYTTDDPGGLPAGNTITVTNPGSQTGNVGKPVSLQMAGTDSDGLETLTWTATGLPSGLVISAAGLITGSPAAAQTRTTTVTATDSTGAHGQATFAWEILPAIVTFGYAFGGASVDNRATGDAKLASWEAIMNRPLRERMYFQQANFPTTYTSLPYAGDKDVPRRMHIDVEPAADGSQVAAFKNFLAMLRANGCDATFRLYHSMHAKFPVKADWLAAYARYGPLITQYGFRLQISFVNYQLTHGQVDGTWVPPGIAFDALTVEWYAHQYTYFGDRLTEALAIANAASLPIGMCEYGANIGADIGNDLHVSEAQGIAFFQYCRDTLANEIRNSRPIAECLAWNNDSGAGVVTPGFEIENQPASWITWYQRIYDLVTKSSPGNPYIW